MNKNQTGRELTRRLVEDTGCELLAAIRFFYNSEVYESLPEQSEKVQLDDLFIQLKTEFEKGNYAK